jgi:uroporphyrin-III C-methyltransferase/precorrin-2 dehydrogenase/sirohydrochlorin ferrochelatase
MTCVGKVWLVGAGPGDPELLTLRAARLLEDAEVVAYDELVSPAILARARHDAEMIPVGRRAKGCRHHEGKIHPLVIERALAGKNVVRLKGGDPLVFGRGGEEAEELASAGIPFAFVPGISAALGAAASTHIPLTHREVARSVTLATAHATSGDVDLLALPREGTIVLYMGVAHLDRTFASLIANGRSPSTPAAVISRATLLDERVVTGTLADLAELARAENLPTPAIVIVGEVVAQAIASPIDRSLWLPIAAEE